jgi:hypothetical protein
LGANEVYPACNKANETANIRSAIRHRIASDNLDCSLKSSSPRFVRPSADSIERCNLTVRMHTRRFTRLTNGFSKKVENHAHSVALFAMYYNFVRVHKTLRVTPAMAANVTKRLWEMSDIVDVLEAWESKAAN